MATLTFMQDKQFLRALDNDTNKSYLVKIEVLNSEEIPLKAIQGRVQTGSVINISGTSSVRRTCNLNIIAEETDNDLTDIDNLLSANKRIRIYEGLKNNVSNEYGEYVWFPLGIFIIIQPNITHNISGCVIQLSCKDKMCLLNGECAGSLPTSVTFHEYDQIIGQRECTTSDVKSEIKEPNNYTIYHYYDIEKKKDYYYSWTAEYGWKEEENNSSVGERVHIPQRIYDIIFTLVHFYGGIAIDKIFINDVPLEIKQIVRYTGNGVLYYNTETHYYTTDSGDLTEDDVWKNFAYGDDVGYVYTDFTYPGSLVSSIGENICSILDKIKNALGNYEYFFDIEGNFIFQEIKNYLNHSYDVTDLANRTNILENSKTNDLSILKDTNYVVDFYSNSKSVYTFDEGSGLIISYSNAPNYNNLKNDFHIWGQKNDTNYPIHYHLVIKKKPLKNEKNKYNTYQVIYEKDEEGNLTGKLRLANIIGYENGNPIWEEGVVEYIPDDWRAELYLQGLTAKSAQKRPDIYQQELLDLFDGIYNFQEKKFKVNLVYNANALNYFFDYLEPVDKLYDCSVDVLGTKIYSYQQDKLNRLYNMDIPDNIILDVDMDSSEKASLLDRCARNGQSISQVSHALYSKIAIGTSGYTAQEVARELLYQYTGYNESISIQSIPIYYLDVNSRITVQDQISGIYGDYIINTISLPLNASSAMSINASRALERI